MALKLADIDGNPFIGVFCRLLGDVVICPLDATPEITGMLKDTLKVEPVRTTLGSTNLHGSLIGGNSKGFIVPYFYDLLEIQNAFKKFDLDLEELGLKGAICDDPHTAWGNNILATERVVLANPDLRKSSIKVIEDTLDVEVEMGSIAGVRTVGSVAAHNSKGMIVHPKITDDEKEYLEDLFKIEVQISTANFGSPYLGASMVVNDNGAVLGGKTSGVEMNRIENALDLIE
jgi:translation initiation factor 6